MFNILYGFLKMFKILDFIVIFIHSKTKKMFLKFWGQNHEISKIRDRHLVELVILRLICVLYAFSFNSLPFYGLANNSHFWVRKRVY